MKYNTRIAPSPTGDMHLGTARTAYFNWLAARATGGKFILRIDDTDQNRSNEKYIQVILDTLEWLGLDYDEIRYQSSRNDRYHSLAKALVEIGCATVQENDAIILNKPDNIRESWMDNVAGEIKTTDHDIKRVEQLVLIKGDGTATYHWASVVDDQDFDINYVIRGNDHLSNTIKQIVMHDTMGHPLPEFAHIGLIHYKKKKLSKRDEAASMLYYRDKGYDSDAMLNFMLRLGWAEKDGKTIKVIDKELAKEIFLDKGAMGSKQSNMDINMLESYDRKYKARKGIWRNKDKLLNDK